MNKKWTKAELNQLYNVEGKTLQEIGDLGGGVSREWVRQVMEKFGLTRGSNRSERARGTDWRRYKTLVDYFEKAGERRDVATPTLRRLAKGLHCSECGRTKNLHIHHIAYPAIKLEDIQFLCASCHYMKHRGNMTYIKQLAIYNKYKGGQTVLSLAGEYRVSRILIYKILRKIRNGNASIRGDNRLGRLSRQC